MKTINNINDINTNNIEGKLLLAALAKISTESQTNKTPDEILEQINILALKMFTDEEEKLICPCTVVLKMFNPNAEMPKNCTCKYIIDLKNKKNN
jgi:hypothetical protein